MGAKAREDGTRGELPKRDKLTPRELEVLKLISQGYSGHKIADILGITYGTVCNYRESMREHLGARSTAHAITIAMDRGLI